MCPAKETTFYSPALKWGGGLYWIWVVRHNFVSTQYFENKLLEFHQILYMHSYIDKIYVGLVTHNSSHNCTRVMALYLCQNFVYAQYLENKFHQILYMHSYRRDLRWDCYPSFLHSCSRVMASDLRQNFVSIQYLENKWTEIHQILFYMHSCRQDLRWDCYT